MAKSVPAMDTAIAPLLDDKEAAAYFKLSRKNGHKTIQKWVREGRLRAARIGDLYRFRKEDLDDFAFRGL